MQSMKSDSLAEGKSRESFSSVTTSSEWGLNSLCSLMESMLALRKGLLRSVSSSESFWISR